MKKLLLITLLALKCTFAESQSWIYHPFATDSATWMQEHVGSDGYSTFYRTYLMGDTTIGAYSYKKVFVTGGGGYYSVGGFSPGPVPPGSLWGALRQDVAAKKVFYYDMNYSTERLLYDFNLNVGDIAFADSLNPYDTIVVSGFDSVNVGGSQHKRLLLESVHGPGSGFMPGNWIEGVGSEAGLLGVYMYGFESEDLLRCYAERNVQQYPYSAAGPYNCYYALGIAELNDDRIEIKAMPNPASDMISLVISCKDVYTVELINESGEVIMKREGLELSGTTIDLSMYAKGLYCLRLSDSKGNLATKKIIKQ